VVQRQAHPSSVNPVLEEEAQGTLALQKAVKPRSTLGAAMRVEMMVVAGIAV
jgi:hypothetical protein